MNKINLLQSPEALPIVQNAARAVMTELLHGRVAGVSRSGIVVSAAPPNGLARLVEVAADVAAEMLGPGCIDVLYPVRDVLLVQWLLREHCDWLTTVIAHLIDKEQLTGEDVRNWMQTIAPIQRTTFATYSAPTDTYVQMLEALALT